MPKPDIDLDAIKTRRRKWSRRVPAPAGDGEPMRRQQPDTSPVDHNGIPALAKPLPPELQAGMWRRLITSGHDQDADLPDILDMLGITEARP